MFCTDYIDDRIDKNDEVYGFDALIDKMDISSIEKKYSREGGRCFHPRTMIKVLFFAYRNQMRSSRRIAWACRSIVQFIYLTGDQKIKYRALANFRVSHAKELEKIFNQTVYMGYQMDLIDGKEAYQDGVKIRANAADSKFKKKSEWEEIKTKFQKEIADYFESSLRTDNAEDLKFGAENDGHSMNTDAKDFKKKLEQFLEEEKRKPTTENTELLEKTKALKAIDTMIDANPKAQAETWLNITDPESRFMKSHGKIEGCFNGQIMTQNQFITAADLVNAETDFDQTKNLVEKHQSNLPETTLEKYGADAGYNKGENLKSLADQNIEGFIPDHNDLYNEKNPDENKFAKSKFTFNEDADTYTCPANEILEFKTSEIKKGVELNTYASTPGVCMKCTFREQCLQTKEDQKLGYRKITVDKYAEYRKEAAARLKTEDGANFYSRRKTEPEPVFGNIRHNMGFRQFMVRGLVKAKGEFMIVCSVHNLTKLIKHLPSRAQNTAVCPT